MVFLKFPFPLLQKLQLVIKLTIAFLTYIHRQGHRNDTDFLRDSRRSCGDHAIPVSWHQEFWLLAQSCPFYAERSFHVVLGNNFLYCASFLRTIIAIYGNNRYSRSCRIALGV